VKSAISAILSCIVFVAGAAAIAADAQPERVRGTISAVSANGIAVKANDGKNVDVQVRDTTTIVYAQPIALTEIKSGDFLGVTSMKGKDGTLTAYDVRRFPKPSNPGHRPFDGREDQTMTNAAVSATVSSAKGAELVLSYEGGSQKVVVSDKASITTLVPGERSQLVAGAPVSLLAAPDANGRLVARSIEVRKPGVNPAQ
jgi:hypothetical protein